MGEGGSDGGVVVVVFWLMEKGKLQRCFFLKGGLGCLFVIPHISEKQRADVMFWTVHSARDDSETQMRVSIESPQHSECEFSFFFSSWCL